MESFKQLWNGDKQKQVVLFSSTAIALYGMEAVPATLNGFRG